MRALPLLLLASACTHDLAVYDGVDIAARDVDMLFVFDTSADRGRYDQMATQVEALEARLAEVDGQVPNLRIGVITSDLGIRGTDDEILGGNVRSCGGSGDGGRLTTFFNPGDAFIEDLRGADGTRIRNFDAPDLETQLALVTNPPPGKVGCEVAQPLEAMRLALDPATNPGFIRKDAMLAVVFLTNDDDCSLRSGALIDPAVDPKGAQPFRCASEGLVCDDDIGTPGTKENCRPREDSTLVTGVAEYVEFLTQFKTSSKDIAISAVVGAPSPVAVVNVGAPVGVPTLGTSCTGAAGSAKPAVRLAALADSFAGSLVDSCTQENAYDLIGSAIGLKQKSCLPNLRAADGDNCRVVEIAGGTETELGSCEGGAAPPCWRQFADADACPVGENLGIQVDRDEAAPVGARVEARCFVAD